MKRASTARPKVAKRSRNGAPGPQNGDKQCEDGVKSQDEPDSKREERMLQRETILTQNLDLEKLQDELLAERAESAVSRKTMVDQSTTLIILQGELAAEKRKLTLQQETIDKQSKIFADFHDRLSAQAERRESLEKKMPELESELHKIQFNLRTAKARTTCFHCQAPRNALCVPCLHLYYCMKCQETYMQNDKKCRFCETVIGGVLEVYA